MSVEGRNPPQEEVFSRTQETLRAVSKALSSLGSLDLTPRSSLEEASDPMPIAGPPPVLGLEGPSFEMELEQEAISTPLYRLALFLAESLGELVEIMEGLRETRAAILNAEVTRLRQTNAALQDIRRDSEVSTSGALLGLDRSLALIVDLAAETPLSARGPDSEDVRIRLRDELEQVLRHLQLRDVSFQRLGHVSEAIAGVEDHLLVLEALDRIGPSAAEGVSAEGLKEEDAERT
jgi:hypothetical protein